MRCLSVRFKEEMKSPISSVGLCRKSEWSVLCCLCVAKILDTYVFGNKDQWAYTRNRASPVAPVLATRHTRSHFYFQRPCYRLSFFIILAENHAEIPMQHDRQHLPIMHENPVVSKN